MRSVDSPELLSHLDAEREWYESATGHLRSLIEVLRSEMTQRVPATDRSVSWRRSGSSYYTRLPAEREYEQLFRDLNNGHGEQLLLDANLLADASGYLDLGLVSVSPDGRLLAYSVDRAGDEVYRLHFRDLDSGTDLDDEIPRSYYGGAWSAGSDAFFYTVHDSAYRPYQVWRHAVGTPVASDVLVLEEPDHRFELNVRSPRRGDLVVIWSTSRNTSETWVVDTREPTPRARSAGGRRPGVEYHVEPARIDGSDVLLVVTNDGATEFRLAVAPVPEASDLDHRSWSDLRPEDPAERLERVDAFAGHAVLSLRSGGRLRLRLLPLESIGTADGVVVDPAFDAGTVALGRNLEYDATSVTVVDRSYVQPAVWSDVDLDSGGRTVRHRQEAPQYDPDSYVSETMIVSSPDGTPVPVTLVRHRDTPLDGTAPALLYGYGAYEYTFEPEWDPALPSLLDRGVVFAHAHVRGGGELGRRWWLEGRLAHKQNTFTDHLAVADGLAGLDGLPAVVDGSRLATRGLSAGGLLQGSVLSQRPERWRAVVAEVPFVDVVTTMLDPDIPLTVTEWDEWGDPRRKPDFDWMLAYSPYDNLPTAGSRPELLVTGALHDPRVMVWEPAKWVAALRASDPDWSPRCVFRCETGAGAHAGPSGRFARLAYEAEIYAWLLDKLRPVTDA